MKSHVAAALWLLEASAHVFSIFGVMLTPFGYYAALYRAQPSMYTVTRPYTSLYSSHTNSRSRCAHLCAAGQCLPSMSRLEIANNPMACEEDADLYLIALLPKVLVPAVNYPPCACCPRCPTFVCRTILLFLRLHHAALVSQSAPACSHPTSVHRVVKEVFHISICHMTHVTQLVPVD